MLETKGKRNGLKLHMLCVLKVFQFLKYRKFRLQIGRLIENIPFTRQFMVSFSHRGIKKLKE